MTNTTWPDTCAELDTAARELRDAVRRVEFWSTRRRRPPRNVVEELRRAEDLFHQRLGEVCSG